MFTVLADSIKAWSAHRAASKGAALSFYALFSITPILLLAIALASYFFGAEAARGGIVAYLQSMVGPTGAEVIQALLASAHDPQGGLLSIGIAGVLLLVGATSVFVELKASLDEMWGARPHQQSAIRVLMRTQLTSFMLVLLLALLLFVSLLASAALALLERFAEGTWIQSAVILSPFTAAVSFGVITCLFAAIYKLLPDQRLSWSDVWIGSLFTAGLFTIGKYVIGLYLGKSAVASGFGVAGSLVALLLWVYYSAQIFFLGAEFTRQYALQRGSVRSASSEGPRR
jgi:membrane protein